VGIFLYDSIIRVKFALQKGRTRFNGVKVLKLSRKNKEHQLKKAKDIMAYVITDRCIACGTCISVCPVEAISEGEIYHIDPDTCISCGSCASVCPNDAIEEG